jgi:hypothetical protein
MYRIEGRLVELDEKIHVAVRPSLVSGERPEESKPANPKA